MYTSILLLLAPLVVSSFSITSNPTRASTTCLSALQKRNEIDVSDLGLTMEDLQKPLPKELFSDALTLSGYQSTSRLPEVDDEGCYWIENADDLDVTLQIPGLRGQPAACLSVLFSTTTISITAFGRVVYSVIQMGFSDPDDCSFITEDGEGMVPIIQLNIQKRDKGERWGGYILQVGEDSIL
jgi:hypothetical protein